MAPEAHKAHEPRGVAVQKIDKPAAAPAPANGLNLPVQVTSPVDVGRLIRELEQLDDALLQLGLRQGGVETKLPKTSQLMDQLISLNKLNLLQEEQRQVLQKFLTAVRSQAPVLHISFSADPNSNFIEKLMAWLRREVHPMVLVTVGLQPNIGAGCIIRSTNKYFDLSLRQDFAKKQGLLREALAPETASAPAATPAPATQPAEVVA